MKKVLFFLHTHIPFVKGYGVWPHGEEWLYEAVLFSYLPLLQNVGDLSEKGGDFRITLSITPILLDMLSESGVRRRFLEYVEDLERRAEEDLKYFTNEGDHEMERLASFWINWLQGRKRFFADEINGDLVEELKRLNDAGALELMTSAATHAYLPLLSRDESVEEQVRMGIEVFERHFGFRPAGFWLPECGYRAAGEWTNPVSGEVFSRPGLEDVLEKHGIKYFFLDPSALGAFVADVPTGVSVVGREKDVPEFPRAGELPKMVSLGGVIGFVRDAKLGMQVWSRHSGYPGDEWYLEFHKRKEGSGLKYWRVTSSRSELHQKERYVPEKGHERASVHAAHFVSRMLDSRERTDDIIPICFDTELFGHWWFEGPEWLRRVINHVRDSGGSLGMFGGSSLVNEAGVASKDWQLKDGSWGERGDHSTWFNVKTKWMWEKVYAAEKRFYEADWKAHIANPLVAQLERQARRELFLMMSSDWMFLVTTGNGGDYGEERFVDHHEKFEFLMDSFENVKEHRSLDGRTVARVNEITRKDHVFY